MDYGKIIRRATEIVWSHKFLMVLGFLAALGGGSNLSYSLNSQGAEPAPGWREFPFDAPFPSGADLGPRMSGALLLLLCLGVVVGVIIFVISNVARGGLIAAVDAIEEGDRPGFGQAWSAGWERVWTLLGIGILPAVPFIILFSIALLGFLGITGLRAVNVSAGSLGMPFGGVFAALACLLIPISLILGLLRTFANRAAMLEGYGTLDAYRRGFSILMENLGEAVILFLLQILISISLFILLLLPGIFVALCCILWPLLFIFQGAVAAFFSALWTLGWRHWSGEGKVVETVKTLA